jgi:adenylate cyclase
MAIGDFKRKLTAILIADVAGYSRLMGEDEAATVKTLATYREVMASLIKQHRGRIVDSPGDNVLAEFVSVVDAVQCAVAVQKELKMRNAELHENRRMEFRIGINLGDVIDEEDRIYGDGVNIAARLEALANPGGICISKTAFDQIETKLPLGYEFMGEQDVKNIAKPVGAYRVLMDAEAAGKVIGEIKPKTKQWRWAAVGALVVLIMVAGALAIWNFHFRPAFQPASIEMMAFPLPDKPSIAVLPFDNIGGDPEQEHFSDGLAENIITQLSQVYSLLIIDRNSSFTYKGKAVKVQQVAEALGVRYVLEGSVQREADRIRVTAQLVDATTGHQLWADRYDRKVKDIFAIQDDITQKIVTEMAVKLAEGENERVMLHPTGNVEAWIHYRRGVEAFRTFSKESNLKSRELSEKAIGLDPDYSVAYSLLGWTYAYAVRGGFSRSPAEDLNRAEELVGKAQELDPKNPDAQNLLGFIYMLRGDYDRAIEEGKRAVELAPNVSDAHALLALSQLFSGQYQEAIAGFKQAMRLAPFYPWWFAEQLGVAYFCAGMYEEALARFEEAVKRAPAPRRLTWKAVAYQALGKNEEARATIEEALNLKPTFNIEEWRKRDMLPYRDKAQVDRILEYGRQAGLPETPPLPLPDRPSIAVLPFTNLSGDPDQEYFCDGITDQIITSLSIIPRLFVIARNSTFTYKGKAVKVQQVARELGVRYVLEGSVQRSEERIRILVQLIDATTERHLWSERYDRDLRELFALQDEITLKIMTTLQVELTEGEYARAIAKGTSNLQANEAFWRAEKHFFRFSADDNAMARRWAEKAVELDPKFAGAWSLLGWTHFVESVSRSNKSPLHSLKQAEECAQRAIAINDSTAKAYALIGFIRLLRKNYNEAIKYEEKAVALNPNDPQIVGIFASVLHYTGKFEESIALMKKAMRLTPYYPAWYLRDLIQSYLLTGRYEEALAAGKLLLERSQRGEFNPLTPRLLLAETYIGLSQEKEARAHAEEVLKIDPNFSVAGRRMLYAYQDSVHSERRVSALRKAGLK